MTTPEPAPPRPAFNYTNRERTLTLVALSVVFLLSALDQTIVSTAMPRIIEQLNGLNLYSWVTTAYLLASTVMVPIYGKLGDLYGRKPILIIGVVLFLVGSALCGMSGEPWFGSLFGGGMVQLIVFRALQGLGGAALFTSAFAIIGDMFAPAERAKFGGLFGGIFGLSSVLGPLVGGFLTDHGTVRLLGYLIEGWRWVFYVNLPLGLVSLFMIATQMPRLGRHPGGKVDVLGAALIIMTTVPLLLALTWGGTTYAWDSARILTLFAVSAVSLVLFIVAERRNPDAILPLSLFKIPVFTLSNMAAFVIGMAFLGVVMFLPLFMQTVLGITATNSGLTMLPLMAGVILSSTVVGQLVAKSGNYKAYMIGGSLVLIGGVFLLTFIGVNTTIFDLAWRMFIVGLGLGPSMSLYTLAVQNAVPMTQMGVATSSSQFFRQIGSTIGTAVFGTLLLTNLQTELPKHLPKVPGMENMASHINLGELRGSGQDQQAAQLKAGVDKQYALIETAIKGNAAATAAILKSPQTPENLRQLFAAGSFQATVHQQVVAQAAELARTLEQGEAGRQALLANPKTPAELKEQLKSLPAAALSTPQAAAQTARQFQQAVLGQEPQIADLTASTVLKEVRATLTQQAEKLAVQVRQGMKEGFSASVRGMFATSIWIIVVGLIINLFIPLVPLRQRGGPQRQTAPAAD